MSTFHEAQHAGPQAMYREREAAAPSPPTFLAKTERIATVHKAAGKGHSSALTPHPRCHRSVMLCVPVTALAVHRLERT